MYLIDSVCKTKFTDSGAAVPTSPSPFPSDPSISIISVNANANANANANSPLNPNPWILLVQPLLPNLTRACFASFRERGGEGGAKDVERLRKLVKTWREWGGFGPKTVADCEATATMTSSSGSGSGSGSGSVPANASANASANATPPGALRVAKYSGSNSSSSTRGNEDVQNPSRSTIMQMKILLQELMSEVPPEDGAAPLTLDEVRESNFTMYESLFQAVMNSDSEASGESGVESANEEDNNDKSNIASSATGSATAWGLTLTLAPGNISSLLKNLTGASQSARSSKFALAALAKEVAVAWGNLANAAGGGDSMSSGGGGGGGGETGGCGIMPSTHHNRSEEIAENKRQAGRRQASMGGGSNGNNNSSNGALTSFAELGCITASTRSAIYTLSSNLPFLNLETGRRFGSKASLNGFERVRRNERDKFLRAKNSSREEEMTNHDIGPFDRCWFIRDSDWREGRIIREEEHSNHDTGLENDPNSSSTNSNGNGNGNSNSNNTDEFVDPDMLADENDSNAFLDDNGNDIKPANDDWFQRSVKSVPIQGVELRPKLLGSTQNCGICKREFNIKWDDANDKYVFVGSDVVEVVLLEDSGGAEKRDCSVLVHDVCCDALNDDDNDSGEKGGLKYLQIHLD